VLQLSSVLAEEVPATPDLVSAVEYYMHIPASANDVNSPAAAAIRARGIESAGADISDLLDRYDKALADSTETLPAFPADHEIGTPSQGGGVRILLTEYLITRMVEMLVHTDDLAVSVGVEFPEFPAPTRDAVIATLACISARRNSTTDVLRALARAERPIVRSSAF